MFCAYCGEEIPASVIQARHYSPGKTPKHVYCDKNCRAKHDQQTGKLQEMSATGKTARSKAVTQPNKTHPRRKRNGWVSSETHPIGKGEQYETHRKKH